MKKLLFVTVIFFSSNAVAQLYIAPGDSLSVLTGTLFTLQENLENHGKIYNDGTITFNGSGLQTISGNNGSITNLAAESNIRLLDTVTIQQSLLINPSRFFELNHQQLVCNGQINTQGFITGTPQSAITLSGSGTSQLIFKQDNESIDNALAELEINQGTVNLQNKLYIYNTLLPNGGQFALQEDVILRSNGTLTARVGPVSGSIQYPGSGRFVVERYIPGKRAWRLLTAPVTPGSNLLISQAWQDGQARVTNINSIANPNPGFGTHVTFGLPATNGYDQGINANPSIRYLNSTGWNGVPTATNSGVLPNSGRIADQPGYMLFVRGDRGTLLAQATGAATSPTVLRPRGIINTGVQNLPLGEAFVNAGNSFSVVSNPYPSAINFHSLVSHPTNVAAGFADAFYVWDPALTGNNAVGGFVALSYNAAASIAAGRSVYDKSVPSSSIPDNGDIPSSSAFVINYSGAATTLRAEEAHKAESSSLSYFRPQGQWQTLLLAENADGTTSVNDGVLINVSTHHQETIPQNHVPKIANFAENLALLKGGTPLSIEKRQPFQATDTIYYQITRMRPKQYCLQVAATADAWPAGSGVWLIDSFLQTRTALHPADTLRYRFAVSATAASATPGRFKIVFAPINRFIAFSAWPQGSEAQLQWQMADTSGGLRFFVERSANGNNFATVTNTLLHQATDNMPEPGTWHYRIRCVNDKGITSYSSVQKITLAQNSQYVYAYPNPVTDGRLTLYLQTAPGRYTCRLLDAAGKPCTTAVLQHSYSGQAHPIALPRLAAGTYLLQAIAANGQEHVVTVLVQ
jgi:hypothetical protein